MRVQLDVFFHDTHPDEGALDRILSKLDRILRNQEAIMATLDETLAAVEAETTADDSIIALLEGLKAQLDEALSGATLPPAVQAKVNAVFSTATNNVAKVTAAVAANTPPAP